MKEKISNYSAENVINEKVTKTCNNCHSEKALIFFGFDAKGKYGRKSKCKDCYKKLQKQRSKFTPDITVQNKTCSVCKKTKAINNFTKNRLRVDGYETFCRECKNTSKRLQYVDKKEDYFARSLKTNYKISISEYYALFESQNGLCAICRTPSNDKKRLHVDHCHKSGKIRGLLCHHCNLALGHFKDSENLLRKAIKYLNK